jgi:hypothetical protein
MTSQLLCLSTDITNSEAAAWVQAIGSILAIVGAVGVAVWQLHKQRRDALALDEKRHRDYELNAVRSMAELASLSHKVAKHIMERLPDRAAVHNVAQGREHLEIDGLRYFESATASIPLHILPHGVVRFPYLLSSCLRQICQKIEQAIRLHEQMDAAEFTDLFSSLRVMTESLEETSRELAKVVQASESDVSNPILVAMSQT